MLKKELEQFKVKLKELIEVEEFEKLFLEFSEILMNDYQLKIEENCFEFVEIEYYYFKCNNHEDTYTHFDNYQKEELNVKCNPKVHQYAVQKCTTL